MAGSYKHIVNEEGEFIGTDQLKVCPFTGEHCNPDAVKKHNYHLWDLIQKLVSGEIEEIRAKDLATPPPKAEEE